MTDHSRSNGLGSSIVSSSSPLTNYNLEVNRRAMAARSLENATHHPYSPSFRPFYIFWILLLMKLNGVLGFWGEDQPGEGNGCGGFVEHGISPSWLNGADSREVSE